MRRAILIASLAACTAVATLLAPGAARAGTYTWSMPSDFTSAAPGSNPDHDSYGAKPWSYVEGPLALPILGGPNPSTGPFTNLPAFSDGVRGALHGWTDTLDPNPFVAVNSTTGAVGDVPPGQLAVNPAADRAVAIAWTSPLPHSATISVSGSVIADDSCSGMVWSLSQKGSALQAGSGSGSISASATVAPGQTIYLGVSWTGLLYNSSCETAGVSLHITADQNTAPTPTLDSPANGALISDGQPRFTGTGGTGFGASDQITVRVYQGTSAAGSPLQTLSSTRGTSGDYTVAAKSPLSDGRYTAVAEQDDVASPPDAGFSQPTTFTVHNAAASIKLDSPAAKPLLTSTPTLTGTAGNAGGDSSNVLLVVYPGPDTGSTPIRSVQGTRDSSGHFSIRITPALPDGEYTAVVVQDASGSPATSTSQTFQIKVHGPALTLTQPTHRSKVANQSPVFGGAAGNVAGDFSQITVLVYAGAKAKGKPVGTMKVRRTGATWSGTWPDILKRGSYTAKAKQSDDAGHTTVTRPDRFQIVRGPNVIGAAVTLKRHGQPSASVTVKCMAAAHQTCTGDVLIVTADRYRPVGGGPTGQLQVMFAYVTVSGGKTLTVTGPVIGEVARILRRLAPLKVDVTASLSAAGGAVSTYAAARTLRLAS